MVATRDEYNGHKMIRLNLGGSERTFAMGKKKVESCLLHIVDLFKFATEMAESDEERKVLDDFKKAIKKIK